jgi:hypothetical protein
MRFNEWSYIWRGFGCSESDHIYLSLVISSPFNGRASTNSTVYGIVFFAKIGSIMNAVGAGWLKKRSLSVRSIES